MTIIDALTADSALQIVVRDQYVNDTQIQHYFEMADVVLALYQRHVGSSGILIRAAAAGKPVLASDYGLMGEWVRQSKLGFTINSEQPSQITEAIGAFLGSGQVNNFDLTSATQFADLHTASHFVQVLNWKLHIRS